MDDQFAFLDADDRSLLADALCRRAPLASGDRTPLFCRSAFPFERATVMPDVTGYVDLIDAFVADPRLRDNPDDIDKSTLLQRAREAREELRDNGFG